MSLGIVDSNSAEQTNNFLFRFVFETGLSNLAFNVKCSFLHTPVVCDVKCSFMNSPIYHIILEKLSIFEETYVFLSWITRGRRNFTFAVYARVLNLNVKMCRFVENVLEMLVEVLVYMVPCICVIFQPIFTVLFKELQRYHMVPIFF